MASMVRSPYPAGVAIPKIRFAEKVKRFGFHRGFTVKSLLKRTRLKRMSKGLKAVTAKYRKLENHFLAQPENKWCEICTRRREAGENICRNQSTEVHHYAGRIGRLLCYVPYFIASCFWCRDWPHKHPKKARELRLLAPPKLWNVFPRNGS